MNQKQIGYFLKTLRKEKGVTQEQLAEMLCVSARTVSRWETGANLPDLSILIELSEYYDVSINDILNAERNDDMDKELKETLQNVADYEVLKKRKAVSAGNLAFGITFIVCSISIAIQMIHTGDLSLVIGETICLICGGIVYFSVIVRSGAWDAAEVKNTKRNSLIISTVSSLVFSAIMLFILWNRAKISRVIGMTIIFLITISIVSYIFLRLMSYLSWKNEKKNIYN